MKFVSAITPALGKFSVAAGYLRSPLLLVIRLFWGWQFFLTGRGKLGDLPKVTEFFASLSIPFPMANAILAGTTECIGGLFLMLGLASRLTALPLIFTMIIAYLTADSEAAKAIFSDPDTFTSAAPFLFGFAAILVLAFGPGKFSLDHLLARQFGPTSPSSANHG